MVGMIEIINKHKITKPVWVPFMDLAVSCGFTSPADDDAMTPLSLDQYLVKNPEATFYVRASGDSMINAGIHSGDLLVVDRSITAKNQDIIVAIIHSEVTGKRLVKKNQQMILKAENPAYTDVKIHSESEFEVWGVVRHVIRHV